MNKYCSAKKMHNSNAQPEREHGKQHSGDRPTDLKRLREGTERALGFVMCIYWGAVLAQVVAAALSRSVRLGLLRGIEEQPLLIIGFYGSLVVLGGMAAYAIYLLRRGDPSAKIIGSIPATLLLPMVPIGTVIGIYALRAGTVGTASNIQFGG